MSLHDYGEDALIEQPAIRLFEELGWETANCLDEVTGPGSFLGRETRSEVVLVARLRPALQKLNPRLPPQAIDAAIEALTRDLVTLSPARANQTMYQLIKNGVSVRYQDRFGEEAVDTVQVIDWENQLENDFFLASQLWITGELYTRRSDLVGFVNGLPLVFIELKASHVRIEDAYNHNLCDTRETIPQLFRHNAFIILSNGSQSRIGSTTAS
jgi:type I restriction enzyme R subunit